ncbi:flagellin N-terminal helical domain-containing protein [[Clostridium] polysaccharolyticum]|uniref:Flagellin n=1 Tax=[Clostridium] polysaccharolyticum TaxID=29364 RepID=A0A1H9Y7F1_9FIRM|nr:flagellin [[Clostridium] polysaccharolyticum]SES64738.1 flagellin C-terminal helical region [[Clostridium] polysaccharolyticum]
MRIQHNMTAAAASRNLSILFNRQGALAEKLSSGYCINRAADNAAGLKISEKMRGQIRGLNQASRNAQDGISFLQTADGALNEVHSILNRVRELTVQASNDTNVDADREAIQQEVDQLLKEVNRISGQTEFNTRKIFDGSLSGTTTSPYLKMDDTNLGFLEVTHDFAATQTAAGTKQVPEGYAVLANILDQEIVPQAVNTILSTFSSAFHYLKDSSTGIGLTIINDGSKNALASVSVGTSSRLDSATGEKEYLYLTYNLTVNAFYLQFKADGTLEDSVRSQLEGTIAHEMIHGFMDELLTKGMVGDDSTRYPLWFMEGMAQSAVGGYANYNDWVNGGLRINETKSVDQISNIVMSSSNKLSANSGNASYGTGYLACMYLGQLASGKGLSSSAITATNISAGLDTILKKLGEGNSLDSVINEVSEGKYTSTAQFEQKFGDTDSATFVKDLTVKVGSTGNGSVLTGDFTSVDLVPDGAAHSTVFDLNPDASKVKNTYPEGVYVGSGGGKTTAGKKPTEDYGTSGPEEVDPPYIGDKNMDISTLTAGKGDGYTFDGTTLRITDGGEYTITGTRTGIQIEVDSSKDVALKMKDFTISAASASGITIGGSSKVTIDVSGKNTITSGSGAAIKVGPSATLTITGDGQLTANAKSGSGAAAIGGNAGQGTGTITINGTAGKELVVYANGDNGEAAIGAGKNGSGGSVNKTNGILFDQPDRNGTVYGRVTVSGKVDTKGGSLTVDGGAVLMVSSSGSIVNGSGSANIINKGEIGNRGSIGSKVTSSGGSLKNYVTTIKMQKPKEVAVGAKLLSRQGAAATIFYNGSNKEELSGNWTVKDSAGNIVDALNTVAEEGQKYQYTVSYTLSQSQIDKGITFADDSVFQNSISAQSMLALYGDEEAEGSSYSSIALKDKSVSADGRTLTVTYEMDPVSGSSSGSGDITAEGFMLQVGANKGQGLSITIDKMDTAELGLDGLSVMSHKDASDSIEKVDDAVSKVSSIRSKIGAYQNRLEYTIENLDNTAENLQSAESRIRDLDIASAMVEYAKNSIIMQAAQAVLAQANQSRGGILKLLQ